MTGKVDVLGVIPARYKSTRFPGKPLALIAGKPMIQWVYERARRAKLLDEVVVATDDRRIEKAVRRFGGKVVMTSAKHRSGTDRVAEVARKTRAALVVNIQGDEPLIKPKAIDQAVQALIHDRACDISTLAAVTGWRAVFDYNVAKVVTNREGYALYFSRQAIPFPSYLLWLTSFENPPNAKELKSKIKKMKCLQHIGLYVYRREALERLSRLQQSPLEKKEKLEQLRALENGLKIKVVRIPKGWPSVDRPEDVKEVERILAKRYSRA